MGRITEMNVEPLNKELLCKDCVYGYVKWRDLPNQWLLGGEYWIKCKKTGKVDLSTFNPVTGYNKKKPDYQYAWSERNEFGSCGPSAKNWSPKHKKDLFKLITR